MCGNIFKRNKERSNLKYDATKGNLPLAQTETKATIILKMGKKMVYFGLK